MLKHKMLDFMQKKNIFLLNPMERIPFQLKSKITLALFSKVLSPLKDFFEKGTTVQQQHLL